MKSTLSLAILSSLGGAHAFWRMECRGRVGLARIDPLVDPGTLSHHVHSIHGSSGFGMSSTYEDLVNADCTSCAVLEDKSVYWAPSLYFRHEDGRFEEVGQEGGMLAYYFLFADRKDESKGIKAFPNDFRMIAGDSSRRNYSVAGLDYREPDPPMAAWAALGQTTQEALRQRAIGFNCLNYGKGENEATLWRHYLPEKSFIDQNCKNGVRFEIAFPSCWNGRDTSSPDHKSHVAYPDQLIDGRCPEGFDVKLPGLMFETIWKTYDFAGLPGEFVISNGDPLGFGYHADFISGWDANFLQQAVNQCRDPSGSIYACPLFTIQSEAEQRKCKMPERFSIASSEKVVGVIGNSLPGGVAIHRGPEPAGKAAAPAHQFVPVAIPNPPEQNDIPGGVFQEVEATSVQAVEAPEVPEPTPEVPAPTPEAPEPSDPPVPEGHELVRTDYVTEGRTLSKIVVIQTTETVLMTTETVTVTISPTANARRNTHGHHHNVRRHRHGHGAHH
ncbi:hypothetical protein VTJ83DRAFT_5789 [Remersonia thermophila]|uniref:DUF1996 domain-containing protein n=1 Tax=Remersonia thermophila TaxID=72144 RepID=A0ABR4D7U8_9PEZI